MLETPRLLLRPWQTRDYPEFAKLNTDPKVIEFLPACLSVDASNALAQRLQTLIAQQGWGFWAVELKIKHVFIGFVGLNPVHSALPFSPNIEIGWRLSSAYWGQGLATEAAQATVQFGFNDLQLTEIVAFTALGNLRSQAVMQRLGMQQGALNFKHPSLAKDHPLAEHCLYRLSRAPYQHIHT
ncbi:MAG: N-acetyltransferase [Thiothrix sp.]|nr:MAG: N-acetyltransferase [Thiothrix sp.]